jgi:ATP-dependent HslUV protease, peptidase subunit HslV
MHGTTIVAVHRDGVTALAGDGQVTLGDTIVKRGAVKVRTLADGAAIAGFAGAVSDAFTLLEKFEGYLETHKGHLLRAAIETVKEWRTDRMLRQLEAMLIVADERADPDPVGLGRRRPPRRPGRRRRLGRPLRPSRRAGAAAPHDLDAATIARTALLIAAEIDLYTSGTATVLTLGGAADDGDDDDDGRRTSDAPGDDAEAKRERCQGPGRVRHDAPRGGRGARPPHHRPAQGEARRRGRAAQPPAPPQAARRRCRPRSARRTS